LKGLGKSETCRSAGEAARVRDQHALPDNQCTGGRDKSRRIELFEDQPLGEQDQVEADEENRSAAGY
jgi:hypothetical protein